MAKYIKIDDSELGNKLRFLLFIKNKKPDWKINAARNREKFGKKVPDINLSDYDFYMECFPKPVIDEYVVLDEDDKIVGSGSIDIDFDDVADLTVVIDDEHQKKGYATNLVRLMEQDLFKREDIKAITIMDYSENRQSSKIAEKLGFEQTSSFCYIKRNPNYKGLIDNSNGMKK